MGWIFENSAENRTFAGNVQKEKKNVVEQYPILEQEHSLENF